MRKSSIIMTSALALTSGLFLWNAQAGAGQFKNIHTPIPNAACVNVHSSPQNVNTAMGMEIYEFQTPAVDAYRCCIQQNATGQDLFVRVIGLTGAVAATFQTAVNGVGCTPFVNLGAPFAFQCTVASGAGSPVVANAHYILGICRQ